MQLHKKKYLYNLAAAHVCTTTSRQESGIKGYIPQVLIPGTLTLKGLELLTGFTVA